MNPINRVNTLVSPLHVFGINMTILFLGMLVIIPMSFWQVQKAHAAVAEPALPPLPAQDANGFSVLTPSTS